MIRSTIRFFNAGGLLKDSSMLFVGMAAVHVCNLLFQVVMVRLLIPDEYALLIALLGIFNIFVLPLGVVASTVNRYASLLIQQKRTGDIKRLVLYWLRFMLILGGILTAYCLLFSDQVASFMHVDRTAPVLIFGVVLMGAFIRPVLDGALMGMQRFGWWSIGSILGWGTRLVVGSLLVLCISPFAGWGLLGHGLGFYIAIAVGAYVLLVLLKDNPVTSEPLPRMHGYLFGSFFILLGYSCLMTGDVVLVKHFYPENASEFSYAATLGRLVVFVPQALVAAMFPKVVSEREGSREQRNIFLKSLLMTLLVTVFSAAGFFFLAEYAFKWIYGIPDPSEQLLWWSRALAMIMVPVSLLSITLPFALAQRKLWSVSFMPLAAACYIGFPFLFDASVDSVLLCLAVVSCVSLMLCGFTLLGRRSKV